MLENIPAYTVKNVEVYKGHTKLEKFEGDTSMPTHLTMDVKLKKEYNNGWIINAQGGYGTSDRYLGRLFASWFSPTTSIIFTALSNNLNDNRTPGKADSWTPEKMPAGTISTHEVGLNYNHESPDRSVSLEGAFSMEGGSSDYNSSSSVTNFLSGGDTYERRFSDKHTSNYHFNTWHNGYFITGRNRDINLTYFVHGDYGKRTENSNDLSASFNKDYSDISRQTLDAIYSNLSSDTVKSIINRAATVGEGTLHSGGFGFKPGVSYLLPGTNDLIGFRGGVSYVGSGRENWNDYIINFGAEPVPAERRRNYTDVSPNHKLELFGSVSYRRNMRSGRFSVNYNYEYTDLVKDSYLYTLDRLEDMGIFGVLPAGYEASLDPSNSYSSRTFTNLHSLYLDYNFSKTFDKSSLSVMLMPRFGIEHNRLDYWSDNRSYLVKRTSFVALRSYATAWLTYYFKKAEDENGRNNYVFRVEYMPTVRTQSPELLHLVDVVNDADPLNIQEGNPNLKNAFVQDHTLAWSYYPSKRPISNTLRANLEVISNALVRGYVYDTTTGIRRHRTYNVDGNINFSLSDNLMWEFGKKKQFTLSSGTRWSLGNNTDMIGINRDTPAKVEVRNQSISENLELAYQIGKQTISINGSATHRHSSSEREDFNTINAQHYKYGVTGTFALPAGFGISTDFNFYKRVGYGIRELDTTDAVWNMRLTYAPPRNKHWVISVDGFDLLHNLSNVNYAVTATGRTVSYTNTLPRYFILTVQYRLNIKPKK